MMIAFASMLTSTAALSVPPENHVPVVRFKKLPGFCRTPYWEEGTFTSVYFNKVRCEAECAASLAKFGKECVAFEYTPAAAGDNHEGRCELHWDEIDRALNNDESRKLNVSCYIVKH